MIQRVLSALVLIPVILVLVWWSYWAVAVVVAVVAALAVLELFSAFGHGGYHPVPAVGIASAIVLILASVLEHIGVASGLLAPALAGIVMLSLVAALSRHSRENALVGWALTVAGALYVGWLMSYIIALRGLETPLREGGLVPFGMQPGVAWLMTTFAITWLQDTLAYFVGRSWGRHKMAPALSPKKTWEGAVGGVVGAVIAGLLCVPLFSLPISLGAGALLGLVGGIVGPLGDLAESLMKRQVGVKDAGSLIPGHGGLLDRADSLMFTAPCLFYLILLLTT